MELRLADLQPGTLHVITGGMRGMKTVYFLSPFFQLAHTSKRTQLFKPACDYREELHRQFGFPRNYVVSRTGVGLPATEYDDNNPEDLLAKINPGVQVIGIAETTLVHPEKTQVLTDIIKHLRQQKVTLVVDGLDKNFRGEPYAPMPDLLALATTVQKHYGVCEIPLCEGKGEFTQKLIHGKPAPYDSPVREVGDQGTYEVRCGEHHVVPGRPL